MMDDLSHAEGRDSRSAAVSGVKTCTSSRQTGEFDSDTPTGHSNGNKLAFAGKSFYLELKKSKTTFVNQLRRDIVELRGVIDDAFSKDTSYVVSDDDAARDWKKRNAVTTIGGDSRSSSRGTLDSPLNTPSPDDASSPNGATNASSKLSTGSYGSRAHALLLKARIASGGNNDHVSSGASSDLSPDCKLESKAKPLTGILAKAKTFGVKVIHVDALLFLIDRWKKKLSSRVVVSPSSTNAESPSSRRVSDVQIRTLKSPYLKYEDLIGHYRPVYEEFSKWPTVYKPEDVVVTMEDEDANEERDVPKSTKASSSAVFLKVKRKKRHAVKPDNRNVGFCKCCDVGYQFGIDAHLASAKHRNFANDPSNFVSLDRVIASLPSLEQSLAAFLSRQDERLRVDSDTVAQQEISKVMEVAPCTMKEATKKKKTNKSSILVFAQDRMNEEAILGKPNQSRIEVLDVKTGSMGAKENGLDKTTNNLVDQRKRDSTANKSTKSKAGVKRRSKGLILGVWRKIARTNVASNPFEDLMSSFAPVTQMSGTCSAYQTPAKAMSGFSERPRPETLIDCNISSFNKLILESLSQ